MTRKSLGPWKFILHMGTSHPRGFILAPDQDSNRDDLTLVLLNKLRCDAHFQFTANQITWSRLLIQIHIPNGKQCRSRSVDFFFFRSQLIWIYTVCKGRVYPGPAGQWLRDVFSIFYKIMVCYVYSLELSRWGDSKEYTQYTFTW